MIQTAEEFAKSKGYTWSSQDSNFINLLTEFAKLHVEAALKAASEKVNYYEDESKGFDIDPNTILNAYNLNQIK